MNRNETQSGCLDLQNRSVRTLLIEDDLGDAILVERILRGNTICVVSERAHRLDEGLTILENCDIDIVLLDLSLPDSVGINSIQKIREAAPEVALVVLTGLTDEQLAIQALAEGAQDYLVKGEYSDESLCRTIRYAVQRHHMALENQRLIEELNRLARTDHQTGVLNRHSFAEQFEREWSRSSRSKSSLSCVMIDIDHFKRLNDSEGHAFGDIILQQFAQFVEFHCRRSDYVARYGGEEFCVVMPETAVAGAETWARRLNESIDLNVFGSEEKEVHITASLGVAARCESVAGYEKLVDMADQALYHAKRNGRNQAVVFDANAAHQSEQVPV